MEKSNYNYFYKNKNIYNDLINENQKLKSEIDNYKKENENLLNKINQLKIDNDKLTNEVFKANKIISSINNKQNNPQVDDNTINNLNEIIKLKDKEINELKSQMKNKDINNQSVDFNKILFVHSISMDQNINCPIKCLETDTFAEVEEKLYQKYEEYRETNNNFITKGKIVLRFKKICENNIKDGDKIELINEEEIKLNLPYLNI